MVESADPRVVHSAGGRVYQVPMAQWIWSLLTTAHPFTGKKMDQLALNVLGDFHQKSLNPQARHHRKRAAAGGPEPAAVASSVPAEPAPAAVAVPAADAADEAIFGTAEPATAAIRGQLYCIECSSCQLSW